MLSFSRCAWVCFVIVPLGGCAHTAMPNWCNPGPASYQMAEARQYDPFPDPSIAPPILGGRPLGFRQPRPEPDVTKNRQFWTLPFANAPPATVPPGSVVTYPPPTGAPVPGTVAYPPTTVPYDPYANPSAPPAAYGTAIPQ